MCRCRGIKVRIFEEEAVMLDSFFGLRANKTTVKQEVVAGLTTFLTMSYVI